MKIFQAVDLRSPTAEDEVAQAATWASQLGGTVDLGFVDDYQYSAHRIRDRQIREHIVAQWGRVRQSHRAELDRLLATLPVHVRGESRYLQGRPSPTLLALESGYELLVVSTRGRRGMAHAFLGSVTERLVRESSIPILVLRRGEGDDSEAE